MARLEHQQGARKGRSVSGYTVAEAAKVLGLSDRRVRQLLDAGRLTALPQEGPKRIDREQIHTFRQKDQESRKPERTSENWELLRLAQQAAAAAIDAAKDSREVVRLAIESRDRVESDLREQVLELRAALKQTEAQRDELSEQLSKARKGKKWGKGK